MKTDLDIVRELSLLIQEKTGVQLGEKQRHMVESRIRKRVMDLHHAGLAEYYAYFLANSKIETPHLVSLLTTHHTYFFREYAHFEYLETTVLPKLVPIARARADRTLRFWSAACSRGQEVYSLGMFLSHYLAKFAPDVKFDVLGTDIDDESVRIAKNGVYTYREIKEVPAHFLADYWARGTGDISDFVKARKILRERVRFETLNLIHSADIRNHPVVDVVFCRNVFIYFTPAQIKSISTELLKKVGPDGYFFIGISETVQGLGLNIKTTGPSIYQKVPEIAEKPFGTKTSIPTLTSPTPIFPAPTSSPSVPSLPNPIRVLCVDDSPIVLKILQSLFAPSAGFEVVGTAINGIDAAKKVAELKPHVMTLDIHMPEQTGIEYLQKNMGPNHIPVVMVSSVSRENAELASTALDLGASDYIEKPALNQLAIRTDEIQTKVRCALRNHSHRPGVPKTTIDAAFKRRPTIPTPEKKLRVVLGGAGDRSRIAATLKDGISGPGILILLENSGPALHEMAKSISKNFGRTVRAIEKAEIPKPGEIYIADFTTLGDELRKTASSYQTISLVYGQPSKRTVAEARAWPGAIFLEETGSPNPFGSSVKDIFPATSFLALSDEYLSRIGENGKAEAA